MIITLEPEDDWATFTNDYEYPPAIERPTGTPLNLSLGDDRPVVEDYLDPAYWDPVIIETALLIPGLMQNAAEVWEKGGDVKLVIPGGDTIEPQVTLVHGLSTIFFIGDEATTLRIYTHFNNDY